MWTLPYIVITLPSVGVVAAFVEEGSLSVLAARVIVAEIVVVIVVVALIISFLVVSVMAPSIAVVQDVRLRILLGPEPQASLILERQRKVDGRDGREEGLGLRRGEGAAEVVWLTAPRLTSTLTTEIPRRA